MTDGNNIFRQIYLVSLIWTANYKSFAHQNFNSALKFKAFTQNLMIKRLSGNFKTLLSKIPP